MKMRTVIITGLTASSLLLSGCASGSSTDAAGSVSAPSATHVSKPEGVTKYPVTLENCGDKVSYDQAPKRAVTLDQASAEVLIRLGLADRMVGTGYETDKPTKDIAEEYAKIPLLAENGAVVSHESLLNAQPDFVMSHFASFFAADKAGERRELDEHGVPTYLTEFDCTFHQAVDGASFEMLFSEYADLAKIFDVQGAGEKLIAEQRAVVEDGLATAKKITGTPSIMWFYSTYDGAPYVAGPGGLPQHVSELIGAKNVFDDAETKWPETSWDEVAARNPDVIVLADLTRGKPGDSAKEKIEILKKDPLTSKLDAVKNERFIIVPGTYMDPSYGSVYALPAVAEGLVDLQ